MAIDAEVNGTAVVGVPVDDATVVDTAGIDPMRIARVTALVGELARWDVCGMSQNEFLEAHDAVARLGRMADVLRARFAGDLARRSAPDLPGGGLARRQGFGNARDMVARITGASQANAMRSIEAGLALTPVPATPLSEPFSAGALATDDPRTLALADGDGALPPAPVVSAGPRYPAIAEATLAGELSVDAAGLIASGLETLTEALTNDELHLLERRLVNKAAHLAAHEVRRVVAHAVARADLRGHEAREWRQYSERYIAWNEDHTGMVTFTGKLDAVTAAPIRTVIEQIVTHQFRARRDQDPTERDQRTVGQMRADALYEVCRHALGCDQTDKSGIRTTMIVRMNESDIDTGRGLGSIDGTHQPVSIGQLRRLAGDAGIIPAVLSGDSEVLDLGRKERLFSPAQRLALLERDGGCAKCHAPPAHCEAHHIRWWENGGTTDLANGVMLCTRCHHDIHRQGWDILVRAKRVNFIPPPTIDPARRPRPGGLAAIDTNEVSPVRGPRDKDKVHNLDEARNLDPRQTIRRTILPGSIPPGTDPGSTIPLETTSPRTKTPRTTQLGATSRHPSRKRPTPTNVLASPIS